MGLDCALPRRLELKVERARRGVDEVIERIALRNFTAGLAAHRLGPRGLNLAFARFGLPGHLHCVAKSLHPIPAQAGIQGSRRVLWVPAVRASRSAPSGTERKEPFYILHERRVRDRGQEIEGILVKVLETSAIA